MSAVLAIVIILCNIFFSNYVVWTGWEGIFVPVLNFPSITYWQLMAISFVIVAFKGIKITKSSKRPNSEELLYISIAQTICIAILWLLIIIGKHII